MSLEAVRLLWKGEGRDVEIGIHAQALHCTVEQPAPPLIGLIMYHKAFAFGHAT